MAYRFSRRRGMTGRRRRRSRSRSRGRRIGSYHMSRGGVRL